MQKSIKPKLVILAIYKKPSEKVWRGFCYPYDVTCNAKSLEAAKGQLESLVELYEEGLKQYDYPMDLSLKELSDKEDGRVFDKVLEFVVNDMRKKMVKDINAYQRQNSQKFKVESPAAVGYYYSQPSFA